MIVRGAAGSDVVRIRARVLDEIVTHARQDSPDECCGLIVGDQVRLDEAVRATNLEQGPSRFRIDPTEHLALIKRLRGSCRAVAGVYHSHPRTPAVPSASDISEAFYPEYVYLIVSLEGRQAETRAWQISGGTATELRIVVEA